jgi:hypothetical protein
MSICLSITEQKANWMKKLAKQLHPVPWKRIHTAKLKKHRYKVIFIVSEAQTEMLTSKL